MKKLIKSINENLQDNKIKDNILDQAFDMWWDRYFQAVEIIVPIKPTTSKSEKNRSSDDMLEEILFTIRDLRNLDAAEKVRIGSREKALEHELIMTKKYAQELKIKLHNLEKELSNNYTQISLAEALSRLDVQNKDKNNGKAGWVGVEELLQKDNKRIIPGEAINSLDNLNDEQIKYLKSRLIIDMDELKKIK